jgi:N4-(beta-N-acetylglucosaminyl)-L-asparaginase
MATFPSAAFPTVIATWPFGKTAVVTALKALQAGKSLVEAAVDGAQAVEDDPEVHSVGYGGLADALGIVTLDACVMDGKTLDCGAVAGLEDIRNPARVALKLMQSTPHVFLVGDGARDFALKQGFKAECLTTRASFQEWDQTRPKPKPVGPDQHDTVTVLIAGTGGDLAGCCSTSGLSHKLHGRVGDSPIIGAGLYVDNEGGAAGATGLGEEIIRICGGFRIVEAMKRGLSPQQACEEAVKTLHKVAGRRGKHAPGAAFIALDPKGRTGAAATPGTEFDYAVGSGAKVEIKRAAQIQP